MTTHKITDVALKKADNVDVDFKIISRGNDCGLIIKCSGEYGVGSLGNDNGAYLCAMTAAALHR